MPAAMFIGLNLLDAYLTKVSLVAGAAEFNPLVTSIGGSLVAKGLMAVALAFILYYFGRERVLRPLNFVLFGVVLWNLAIYWIVTLARPDYIVIGI
jgi:hypothetical protein